MKTWFVVLLMSVLLLGAVARSHAGGWLIYHDGPYEGQVLDDETSEPIEGAAVAASWDLDPGFPFGGHGSIFFDAQESVTNKEGKFKIESKIGFNPWPFASMKRPVFLVYIPGYDSYPPRLPITNQNSTFDDWQNAQNYRAEHMVAIEKNKNNIIKLKRTTNDNEREWVLPGKHFSTELPPYLNTTKHLWLLINEEERYLKRTIKEG